MLTLTARYFFAFLLILGPALTAHGARLDPEDFVLLGPWESPIGYGADNTFWVDADHEIVVAYNGLTGERYCGGFTSEGACTDYLGFHAGQRMSPYGYFTTASFAIDERGLLVVDGTFRLDGPNLDNLLAAEFNNFDLLGPPETWSELSGDMVSLEFYGQIFTSFDEEDSDYTVFTGATAHFTLPQLTPVPEPGTWALLSGGLLALGIGIRRQRE